MEKLFLSYVRDKGEMYGVWLAKSARLELIAHVR